MPIYEYQCQGCRRRVSVFFRSFSVVTKPSCTHCGSQELKRLVSQVTFIKPWGESLNNLPDFESMSDVDENDPKAVAKLMRRYKTEMAGEESAQWNEMADMMEAGFNPEDLAHTENGDSSDDSGDSESYLGEE